MWLKILNKLSFKSFASSSKGNCYLLDDGEIRLLIECGLPINKIKQALDFKLSSVAGCLVTHEHSDHSKAVNDLLKAGVDCYMSYGTSILVCHILNHRCHIIKSGRQFKIGTWNILPFETIHDAEEPLGFLLQSGKHKVLFATDSAYIKPTFKGLTHICVECNYIAELLRKNVDHSRYKRTLQSHMGLETCLAFLAANDLSSVREIHLLHMSDTNSDAEQCKKAVQAATGKRVVVA